MDGFRIAIGKAVRKAVQDGKLTHREGIRLRAAMFAPNFRDLAQTVVVTQMAFSGESQEYVPRDADGMIEVGRIDWEGLAAFLERILPLLLELLRSGGIS